MAAPASRLVWDLPVRVTHWALLVAVTGCVSTHYAGIEWFHWHRRFGCAVLVLAAFRVVWGVVGTRHARFARFVRGPRATLAYLRGAATETVGHDPLGALGIVALLVVLLAQASSGLFANDEIMNAGPFYGWIAHELSNRMTSLHRAGANVLFALVGLHVGAVAWHSLVRRRRLVRAMITGRKDAALVPAAEAIDGSGTARALLIVLALATALALAIDAAPAGVLALY